MCTTRVLRFESKTMEDNGLYIEDKEVKYSLHRVLIARTNETRLHSKTIINIASSEGIDANTVSDIIIPAPPYGGHQNNISDPLITQILNTKYDEILRNHFNIRPILGGHSYDTIDEKRNACGVISNAIMQIMSPNRKIKLVPIPELCDTIKCIICMIFLSSGDIDQCSLKIRDILSVQTMDNYIGRIDAKYLQIFRMRNKKYAIQLNTPGGYARGHAFTIIHIKGRYYILQSFVNTYSLQESPRYTRIDYTPTEIINILQDYLFLFTTVKLTDKFYEFLYRITGIYRWDKYPDQRYTASEFPTYPIGYTRIKTKKKFDF